LRVVCGQREIDNRKILKDSKRERRAGQRKKKRKPKECCYQQGKNKRTCIQANCRDNILSPNWNDQKTPLCGILNARIKKALGEKKID